MKVKKPFSVFVNFGDDISRVIEKWEKRGYEMWNSRSNYLPSERTGFVLYFRPARVGK